MAATAADGALTDVPLPLSREELSAKLTPEIMLRRVKQPFMIENKISACTMLNHFDACEVCKKRGRTVDARYRVKFDGEAESCCEFHMVDPTVRMCALCLNEVCLDAALIEENETCEDEREWALVPVTHRSQCDQCGLRLWAGDAQFTLAVPDKETERWCYACCDRKVFTEETPTVKAVRKE